VVQPADLAWHLPSTSHDRTASPNLHRFLEHVRLVVSFHGYQPPELPHKIHLGGTNRSLARTLDAALTVEGIPAVSNLAAIPKRTDVSMAGIRSLFRSRQVFKSNFPARCADPYRWPASRERYAK